MPADFVFIATLGQNDVHVVVRPPDGPPRRHPLRKDAVRAFHTDCLRGAVKWHLTPLADTTQLRRCDRQELQYVPDCRVLAAEERFDGSPGFELPLDPQVELCAPLLAAAWEQIQARRQAGDLGQARFVLLLNTRREETGEDGEPREAGEPIAAGTILRDAAVREFHLTGDEQFKEHFFLTAGDLYEIDSHNQRHLRADAAAEIDRQIRGLPKSERTLALISEIGGFPETKAVVQAAVAYRFDGRFEFVRPVERGRRTRQRAHLLISPAESLNTRHQIRRLINRGSFDAAAELARHPSGDEALQAEPWRRSVIAAAAFLRGGIAGSCSGRTAAVLRSFDKLPRSLIVLFRIEAALRHGDCETAVRETVTFSERAGLELADQHLSAPGQHCVDWTRVLILGPKTCDSFRQVNRDAEYWVHRPTIASFFPPEIRRAWVAVDRVVADKAVRQARNESVHAHLSAPHLERAVQRLVNQKLWTRVDDAALSIVQADAPRKLFQALRLGEPQRRYADFVAAICEDMDSELESAVTADLTLAGEAG